MRRSVSKTGSLDHAVGFLDNPIDAGDLVHRARLNCGEKGLAMRIWLGIAALLLMNSFAPLAAAEPVVVDVCVYGATPAGVAAAVAAARAGSKVALVEPLQIVGGMMSSGLSFSDSNQMAREALGGFFEEFHLRVEKHYLDQGIKLPYSIAEKNNVPWVNEPHVAEQVFNDLLKEAGVQVHLGEQLLSASKTGVQIDSIQTTGQTFQAKVFVDASYEGDLLPAAKVGYVVGREPAARYGESLAGHQYPKLPVNASPFDDRQGLLPFMTATDAGDPTQADGHVMVYSFRLCVTDVPEKQVPFPEPEAYDPAEFELVRRYLKQTPNARQLMDFYPLPNGKTDVNNSIGGQISLGLVGGSDAWPDATPEARAQIWQKHKQYTLGLIHFLRTDPAVPERLRTDIRRWGLCKDEFVKTGHWPPVLYIREARRMKGGVVLTQNDVLTNVSKPDSIGVASFPIDSHDCQRIPTSYGGFVNEGTIFPRHIPGRKIGQPYEVPYRSITPLEKECDNLLVPVCLSSSHVAMSSIRVEPSWIVIGHSAGAAAHLAAKKEVAVQKLDYAALESLLLEQKQVLHWK
ncbi:FAD-dependent oxidoreductase [Planctomicrobium piriforme]|uniref:FAD dependent oxidoreductase n=1 Tax=Planctomicrobium piriforme TaxID=1576369 RepID=A0A1I3DG42_9PLAN|nr:FAD-dependent oxidoreductase [Planctomicrobium piriforme]SFH85697.1 FAD dependent oxidoreductase [Planctomicrobium piriforme]